MNIFAFTDKTTDSRSTAGTTRSYVKLFPEFQLNTQKLTSPLLCNAPKPLLNLISYGRLK